MNFNERALHCAADLVLMTSLAASALVAVAIGNVYGSMSLALPVSSILLIGGAAAYWGVRGTLLSRMVLTMCLAASVALHIQLGRGTLEFHFGVFVTLALVLVYRDWRPILAGALFFAVHHLFFDWLQTLGVGVYCTPDPGFLKMLMHASYVVAQASLEIYIAIKMSTMAAQGDELVHLIQTIDGQGVVSPDLSRHRVTSSGGAALKRAVDRIAMAMTKVQGAAARLEVTSTEIARGNQHLSHRTEQTSANLQQATVSMDRLSDTVKQSAQSARRANQLAVSAAEVAARGGSVVSQVVATMAEINDSSKKIADIISVIDGIAFQTNILALNAAVEAARAGDQGRGFAVVAAEVRSLAQRSAAAAKEIKLLIDTSVDKVESGSILVADAGSTMHEIVASVQRVSDIVGEISAASAEQTSGIDRVCAAVTQLDRITHQNAALVEESAAAAESLKDQSRKLSDVVASFRLAPEPTSNSNSNPNPKPKPMPNPMPMRLQTA